MKFCFIFLIIFPSCSYINHKNNNQDSALDRVTTLPIDSTLNRVATLPVDSSKFVFINTNAVEPILLVDYAKTLIGVPYKYASTDPAKGFDCSGFITYTFNHFNINVPRSSVDFTNVYHEVPLKNAKQGDLILFTGTDSTIRTVGHMGIVVSNVNDSLAFIHSTSGKANGVTITPLNEYYMGRFVKIVRVFPQNDLPN